VAHLRKLLQPNLRQPRNVDQWLTVSPVLRLRIQDAIETYADIWAAEMARTVLTRTWSSPSDNLWRSTIGIIAV
jgi:hypothetical protein